ncbi:MAG: hypothetical protein F7C32_00100 [Desulfurococcales archaeon]|nr:hypothetical protein [Desulfurococcales archaeon]
MSKEKGSKDFKLVTFKVVTLDQVVKNERLMDLLYLISRFKSLSEKSIYHLVYEVQQKGYDLGYKFFVIGGRPNSKQLKDDLVALFYVELLETEPRYKKIRLTNQGKDVVEQYIANMPSEKRAKLDSLVGEIKKKITIIDSEAELESTLKYKRLYRR